MTVFRTAPSYNEPLVTKDNTTTSWYRFFQAIDSGLPPSGELPVTVTASPFLFTTKQKGFVIVSGGTVSLIQFSRTPGTFYPTGQTAGTFPVSQNDLLQITYSVMPNLVFIPQ